MFQVQQINVYWSFLIFWFFVLSWVWIGFGIELAGSGLPIVLESGFPVGELLGIAKLASVRKIQNTEL